MAGCWHCRIFFFFFLLYLSALRIFWKPNVSWEHIDRLLVKDRRLLLYSQAISISSEIEKKSSRFNHTFCIDKIFFLDFASERYSEPTQRIIFDFGHRSITIFSLKMKKRNSLSVKLQKKISLEKIVVTLWWVVLNNEHIIHWQS